jgi:hypothetical protein
MPFQLPNQTSFATLKPTYSGSTWVRPVDWITIVDAPNEVHYLVSDVIYPVYAIETQFTRPGAQNIYIDWGDGVIDTISTIGATTTNHTYTSGGTPCSLGYNTWKIRIYGDAGAVITRVRQKTNTSYWGSASITQGRIGLLEAYYGDNLTTLNLEALHTNIFNSNLPITNFLEYVKLPATNTTTSFIDVFYGCEKLRKVVMPQSLPNITSANRAFFNCFYLPEVILPNDMVNLTITAQLFQSCRSLTSVRLPNNLNQVIDAGSMFNGCFALGSIQFPSTNLCADFNSMFLDCRSLLDVKIPSCSTTSASMNFNSMFSGCRSLESVSFPPRVNTGILCSFRSVFANCFSLKIFNGFPINFNSNDMNSAFQNCSSITSVVFPASLTSASDMLNCFQNCFQLSSITLPPTSVNSLVLQGTFNNCFGLSEVIIPSGLTINNYQLAFAECSGLKKGS